MPDHFTRASAVADPVDGVFVCPPAGRLLRRTDLEARLGVTRATIYRLMREGDLPSPIRIGARAVRWHESEIDAWLASRPRATGDLEDPARL